MKNNFSEFKKDISIKDNELFLNFAATAPLTHETIKVLQKTLEKMQYPLGQYIYEAINDLEFARRDFAQLVNAHPKEIAFTQNTSTALSTIALGISWQAGDRILVPGNEFPSNYYPWLNLKNKGVICETFTPVKNEPIVETLKKLDLKRVKLISISAVSYETGRLYELEDFAKFCRSFGIYSCIDAIQAIGATPFDVKKIDMDFMASGAQKWLLGPVGCGMIYVKSSLLEKMHVPYVGWTSVKYPEYLDLKELEFSDEMTRFEPGLPGYLSILGMHTSLKRLNQIGYDRIFNQISYNTQYLKDHLTAMKLELLLGEHDKSAAIVSFKAPINLHARDIQELFDQEKVKVTARADYVRVSPHFFNDEADLDRLLNSVHKIFNRPKAHLVSTLRPPDIENRTSSKKILITGASGAIGKSIAKIFLEKGHELILISKTEKTAHKLKTELEEQFPKIKNEYLYADFSNQNDWNSFMEVLEKNYSKNLYALINCAGVATPGLFHQESIISLQDQLKVNFSAPMELMYIFINKLRTPDALGILTIVSSTGRCGSPVISAYSSSQAALWTLSESLSREYSDQNLTFTTFVSPALHSPFQKTVGRIALRYFRASGKFDYDTPENIAILAADCFLGKKSFYLSPLSRAKILLNAIWPEKMNQMILKLWRK